MPPTNSSEVASPTPGGRGSTPTSLCRAPTGASAGAPDLELLATSAYLLGRDDEYVSGSGARASRLPGRRRTAARGALRVLARHPPHPPRRDGPRDRLARPRPAAARTRGARLRRAGLSAAAARSSTQAAGDYEAAIAAAADAAAIGERFGDADLLALAGHERGLAADQAGAGRGGPRRCWTRPWSRSPRASCRRSSPASSTAA